MKTWFITGCSTGIGAGLAKAVLELLSEGMVHELSPLGIKVMIVEPGSFRTKFYTEENLKKSAYTISDYADTSWKRSASSVFQVKDQPGDSDKAGRAIVEMIEREDAPLRFVLGTDGYEKVKTALDKRQAELEKWKEYSSKTDF